jgi:glycosyltransferase involved in cell wall biosynthesis
MQDAALRVVFLGDAAHTNTQRWCEGLTQAGADIYLLSFNAYGSRTEKNVVLPIRRLPGKLHYLAAVPRVRQLIRDIRPDVVVAYYVTGYGTLGALTGFHPLIQVTAGSDILLAPQNRVMRRLVRHNFNQADLVTAWAPHMAQATRQLGVTDGRILVLPRGIPFQEFAGSRCSPPAVKDFPRMISTRSLKKEYNLDLLLRALSVLNERGASFSLTLAGDGPYREELVALSQKLGLQKQVRFAGFVNNDRLPGLLAEHNLYISPVDSDGVSASLLEAMAVGLLPIVPDHPANRSWVNDGQNGLLLHTLSAAAVADALARAADDLGLRQRAWERNSEIVRQRADLYRNSEIFVEQFRKLARDYRNSSRPGSFTNSLLQPTCHRPEVKP